MKNEPLQKTHEIHLSPILGIHPGKFIIGLLIFFFLICLLGLSLLPGLLQFGSEVQIRSIPDGAAVYVDGTYVGATPYELFIPAGDHTITVESFGFNRVQKELSVPGRRFMSLFFLSRVDLEIPLELVDEVAWAKQIVKDLALISRVSEVSENTFHADLFDRIVSVLSVLPNTLSDEELQSLLIVTGALVSNNRMLEGYQDMVSRLERAGVIPETRVKGTAWYLPLDDAETISHLAILGDHEGVQRIIDALVDTHTTSDDGSVPAGQGRVVEVLGESYVTISSQTMVVGDADPSFIGSMRTSSLPYPASVKAFTIQTQEVTESEFADFVSSNPTWSPENIKTLVQQGLVDEGYLADVDLSSPQEFPIRSVSWYAAQAFCSWKSESIQESLPDAYVALPTSSEWEVAARIFPDAYVSTFGTVPAMSYLPYGMFGSVWELCEDAFIPHRPLPIAQGDRPFFDELVSVLPDITVKGGSWLQSAKQIGPETLGSFPKDMTSRYIGFRTVVRK